MQVQRYRVDDQPRWCRKQYVSGVEAPAYWDDRIARISKAWHKAEYMSVAMNLREAALVFLSEKELEEAKETLSDFDLVIFPVARAGGRYMICQRGREQYLAQACNDPSGFDDEVIGKALGYPECCRAVFREEWGRDLPMWRDPVIPMAERSMKNGGTLDASCHPAANILLRKMGVRYCPHLPCRADCQASAQFGLMMRVALYAVDAFAGNAADRLLMSPMEWSSWHGMGEFILPAFRYSFDTDPVAEKYVVKRNGVGFLDGAATNGDFPFNEQRSAAKRNGFSSHLSMDRCHQAIEQFAQERLGSPVLDLGCGDGRLARRLAGFERCFGVESAYQASELARGQLYDVRRAKIEQPREWFKMLDGEQVDLILFQPGRMVEATSDDLENFLLDNIDKVLLYNYDRKLKELCVRSGVSHEKMEYTEINGVQLAWYADVVGVN